jgi:trk system potassium uptake protein TrkA
MRIVIAGAGAVGTHLSSLLSKEDLDVVLIDNDLQRLSKFGNELDIMTHRSEPTSIKAMKECNVDKCDLFIAVTPHESVNLICCMLAHQLGAKKTVARIDNYEYMKSDNFKLFSNPNIGIDSLIYPELLASKEIVDSAQYSWVRQWWEFHNGELVLLSVKIHRVADIIGKTLKEIGKENNRFHVVAIKRSGETISPHGDEKILKDDLVYFMVRRQDIDIIKKLTGKDDESYPPVKHVLVLGGGKLSVRTSWAFPNNIKLKIIEPNMARCEELSELVKENTTIINGEVHDMAILEDEGFNNCEALIALTDNDDANILACVAARRRGITKTIAQVENLDFLSMAEDLDVGTIINKKTIAASHIYRMLMKADVDSVKMLNVAEAEVAEFVVKDGSKVSRKLVKDLSLPRGVNLGGLQREGHSMLINGMTQMQTGDKVVAFCVEGSLKKLDKYFK